MAREDHTQASFAAVRSYARILRQTQVANEFTLGARHVSFRKDDWAFTITYSKEGRRLQFMVNHLEVAFTRAELMDGRWLMSEGQVTEQVDTWMLLRWLSDAFPPQIIESACRW